jgi:alpha-ribazole phosphatase
MRLTLVRHGATEWNVTRRFQGHSDIPLSAEGRAQAAAVASSLAEEKIDVIYSSDLSRALETARTIALPHDLEVVSDARLREFHFGEWEGLTWPEIMATRPHLQESAWKKAHLYAPEGGETYDAVWARVRAFYRDLLATAPEHAIVVSHAGVLHAMLDVAELSGEVASFAPASITRIVIDSGRARVHPQ